MDDNAKNKLRQPDSCSTQRVINQNQRGGSGVSILTPVSTWPLFRRMQHAAWRFILTPYWQWRYGAFGVGSEIQKPALLIGSSRIFIGNNVKIWYGSRLEAIRSSTCAGSIRVGDGTCIHPYAHIGAVMEICIGRGVLVASGVYITDHDHFYGGPEAPPITNGKVVASPVVIDDYVWLGERVMVLKGVTIGHNSVIGAGSVVTKNVPPYCVAVGTPARVVRTYCLSSKTWNVV